MLQFATFAHYRMGATEPRCWRGIWGIPGFMCKLAMGSS
jgi:hypothetical protein